MDSQLFQEGTGRLAAAKALADRVISLGVDGDLDQALSSGDDALLPGEVSAHERRAVLRALGVIEVRRGRGASVLLEDARVAVEDRLVAARSLWTALCERRTLSLPEVEEVAKAQTASVTWLLKTLQLAVGRLGRQGGLQLVEVAEQETSDVGAHSESTGGTEEEKERTWYPFADAALAELGFQTAVTGDRSWGGGEWGTPDVVGYYVAEAPSQLIPNRRVAAVEVKLSLSRSSVAQAASYQRFAHYVYLATPQTIAELEPELRVECGRLGIGVFCRKQANSSTLHMLADARWHACDEEAVEALLERLKDADDTPLSYLIRKEVRRAFFQALANSED